MHREKWKRERERKTNTRDRFIQLPIHTGCFSKIFLPFFSWVKFKIHNFKLWKCRVFIVYFFLERLVLSTPQYGNLLYHKFGYLVLLFLLHHHTMKSAQMFWSFFVSSHFKVEINFFSTYNAIFWKFERNLNSERVRARWIQRSDQLNLDCFRQIKEVIKFSEKRTDCIIFYFILFIFSNI